MQVRRVRRRVAGRADVPDDIAAFDALALAKTVRVPFEMRVVIADRAGRIELIHGIPAGLAVEQLCNRPVFGGVDRGVARGEDVDGLMRAAAGVARLAEHALEPLDVHSVDWHAQISTSETVDGAGSVGRAVRGQHRLSGRRHRLRRCGRLIRSVRAEAERGRKVARQRRAAAKPPAGCDARSEAKGERGQQAPTVRTPAFHRNNTGVPGCTIEATRAASQLVRRTHPCDWV